MLHKPVPKADHRAEAKVVPKADHRAEAKVVPKVDHRAEARVVPKADHRAEARVVPKAEARKAVRRVVNVVAQVRAMAVRNVAAVKVAVKVAVRVAVRAEARVALKVVPREILRAHRVLAAAQALAHSQPGRHRVPPSCPGNPVQHQVGTRVLVVDLAPLMSRELVVKVRAGQAGMMKVQLPAETRLELAAVLRVEADHPTSQRPQAANPHQDLPASLEVVAQGNRSRVLREVNQHVDPRKIGTPT